MFKKLIQVFVAPLSPKDFTREVGHYIENLGNGWEPHVIEPLHIEVCREKREPLQMHLNNAYLNYLQNRGARKEIVARYVDSILSLDEEKLLPKDIIPTIKDKSLVRETAAHLKAQGQDASDFFTTEEFNEELEIVYAVDSPQSIRYLNPSSLKELHLQGETLRSLAVSNLKRILPAVEVHGQPPLFAFKAGGMFEASLLLLDRVWDKKELGIEGDIVVAVPARDTLLVADGASEEAIAQLRKAAAQIASSAAYALTDRVFIRKGSRFEVWDGPVKGL